MHFQPFCVEQRLTSNFERPKDEIFRLFSNKSIKQIISSPSAGFQIAVFHVYNFQVLFNSSVQANYIICSNFYKLRNKYYLLSNLCKCLESYCSSYVNALIPHENIKKCFKVNIIKTDDRKIQIGTDSKEEFKHVGFDMLSRMYEVYF